MNSKMLMTVGCLMALGDVFGAKPKPRAVDAEYDWRDDSALTIEGRAFPASETRFVRLPDRWKERVTPAVWSLSRTTIGFSTRFVTDSNEIVIRWKVGPNLPPAGNGMVSYLAHAGVDVYSRANGGKWSHVTAGMPKFETGDGELRVNWKRGEEALVYLPIRTSSTEFSIGVKKGASFAAAPKHAIAKPIVHYGTSIVNGGGVSRAGLVFSSHMGRIVDAEVINFGFSGWGKMELPMAELLAEVDASLYIVDCDWNMNPQLQKENYEPFMRKLRALKPDTPILVCGGCTEKAEPRAQEVFAKGVIDRLKAENPEAWKNVSFLSGVEMLPNDDECTHDHCHPNDYGMVQMARVYAKAVRQGLNIKKEGEH